ncbi:MAG: hypothetical protein WC444_07045 [Candidatus Paceibacterota bacterium]
MSFTQFLKNQGLIAKENMTTPKQKASKMIFLTEDWEVQEYIKTHDLSRVQLEDILDEYWDTGSVEVEDE